MASVNLTHKLSSRIVPISDTPAPANTLSGSSAHRKAAEMLTALIDTGDLDKLETTFKQMSATRDSYDIDGNTPLIHAIKKKNGPAVLLMLQLGALAGVQQELTKQSPLAVAVQTGQLTLIEPLLQAAEKQTIRLINIPDEQGVTPLMHAVLQKNLDAVKILIVQKNINLNHLDKGNRTALYHAFSMNEGEIAKVLMNAGANPFIAPMHRATPAILLASSGQAELLQMLLTSAAQPGSAMNVAACLTPLPSDFRTPLHHAAARAQLSCIRELLKHHSNLCWVSSTNRLPLHEALESANEETVSLLLDAYASYTPEQKLQATTHVVMVTEQTPTGHTLLHHNALSLALKQPNVSAVEKLLEFGADPAALTSFRPIQTAIALKRIDLVNTLMSAAARRDPVNGLRLLVDERQADGRHLDHSTMDSAVNAGDYPILELLYKSGAPLKLEVPGASVLHGCAANGNLAMLQFLLGLTSATQDADQLLQAHLHPGASLNDSLLLAGVRSFDPATIGWLIQECVRLNIGHDVYARPLYYLASANRPDILRFYLEKVEQHAGSSALLASFMPSGPGLLSPVLVAATRLDVASIEVLAEKGVPLDAKNDQNSNLLAQMAIHDDIEKLEELVQLIVAKSPPVPAEDSKGPDSIRSPLLQQLLDEADNNMQTPAMAAARRSLPTLLYLLSQTDPERLISQTGASGNFIHDAVAVASVPAIEAGLSAITDNIDSVEKQEQIRNVLLNQKNLAGQTPLVMAVLSSNVAVTKALLKQGADPEQTDAEDYLPLHHAVVTEKNEEMIHALMKQSRALSSDELKARQKRMLETQINQGVNAMIMALTAIFHHSAVKELEKYGGNFDHLSIGQSRTVLYLASCNGQVSLAKTLLDKAKNKKADADGPTLQHLLSAPEYGVLTPLIGALGEKQTEIVELLFSYGADLKNLADQPVTPVHMAAHSGDLKMLNTYLDEETAHLATPQEKQNAILALINKVCSQEMFPFMTPLGYAIAGDHDQVALRLLDLGANMLLAEVLDNQQSLFHMAAAMKSPEVIKKMLQKIRHLNAASPFQQNKAVFSVLRQQDAFGNTPLFSAIEAKNREMVALLANERVLYNHQDRTGQTMLHKAVESGDATLLQSVADAVRRYDSTVMLHQDPDLGPTQGQLDWQLRLPAAYGLNPLQAAIYYKNEACYWH